MQRSRARRSIRSAPRRKLVWARTNPNFTLTIPATAGDNFGVPQQLDALDRFRLQLGASPIGATIVRVRGVLAVSQPSVVAAVNALVTLHVADTDEAARSLTDADNAFSQRGAGNDYFMVEPFLTVNPVAPLWGTAVAARTIDVKSSRKVEELNQTIVCRFHGSSTVATNLNLTGHLSLLLALP